MKYYYNYRGVDGFGGAIEGITKQKYSTMKESISVEIEKSVHRLTAVGINYIKK